jgi:hypothetical protein
MNETHPIKKLQPAWEGGLAPSHPSSCIYCLETSVNRSADIKKKKKKKKKKEKGSGFIK